MQSKRGCTSIGSSQIGNSCGPALVCVTRISATGYGISEVVKNDIAVGFARTEPERQVAKAPAAVTEWEG